MALASDKRTTPLLLILLAGILGYAMWSGSLIDMLGLKGVQQQKERMALIADSVAALDAATDSAKAELAKGTVEDLRRRLEGYRASLALMRRLVPERNEVPNLLDDISTRAKIRGVSLAEVSPLPEQPGPAPFTTHMYGLRVVGHYDQIGEFMADIASLQRIIVPVNVTVAPAPQPVAKAMNDSSGALLEARFQVRTYVKSSTPEGEASGT
ncbi:MAG: type 4a pilus biogenesis protein PilO [Gemmatimonadales bacterium]|jgi:type IV pilus assembly protein PilO|nr:type 4a pilus biogenesis protein PilO [Gemmatimonadales bacterium]